MKELLIFVKGAVKITPSHDFNDFEMAIKHNLQFKTIFNDEGKLDNVSTEYKVGKQILNLIYFVY